jgi:hypothetical protein
MAFAVSPAVILRVVAAAVERLRFRQSLARVAPVHDVLLVALMRVAASVSRSTSPR